MQKAKADSIIEKNPGSAARHGKQIIRAMHQRFGSGKKSPELRQG